MALGAQPADVVRLFLTDGSKLVLTGIAIGLAGAFAASRLLSSMLFQVTPTDALTYAAVILLLLAASLLATHLPARRASRIDAIITIRQ